MGDAHPTAGERGPEGRCFGHFGGPGRAPVVNTERGIQQAKRTLVVLSQAYLEDNMADFENVAAQSIGIEEGSYRLLPVKIGPIDEARLPLRLGMLATLDLTIPGALTASSIAWLKRSVAPCRVARPDEDRRWDHSG